MSHLLLKNVKRLRILSSNAIYFNLPVIINAILPIVIIKYHDLSWWGHIVELTVICAICSIITAWGAKEHLLKEFSDKPGTAKIAWAGLTNSRLLYVLFPICLIPLFIFTPFVAMNLLFWILMRFIAQSYDAIVAFERRYTPSMLGEVVNFLITVGAVVIFKDSLSYERLLLILSAGYFLKSLILVVAFREYSKALLFQDARFELLKGPFFFMLLTVTGMLASKIDIIMMTLAVDKPTLAEYQIILSFLALIQSGAALIFQPYVKVFYRINQKGKAKMAKSLSLWGLSLCALGLTVTYFILLYAYHIRLSEPMIITSFFYALMPFLSVPLAYRIYKVNRPDLVLRTSILAIIIFVLMFSVINYFNIGDLSTILAIAALHQIGTVVLFIYFNRRKFLNS